MLALTLNASADVIVPVGQQGSSTTELPEQGQKLEMVLEQFGDPKVEHNTVGEPPITRWDYEDFIVVFEDDTVIQAVRKHLPSNSLCTHTTMLRR